MEIDITTFFNEAAPMDYSASIAEIGSDAPMRATRLIHSQSRASFKPFTFMQLRCNVWN